MQKGFSAVFILISTVVVLAIFSLGVYYLYGNPLYQMSRPRDVPSLASPRPSVISSIQPVSSDETAGWKIYTSEKYKISFKYPPFWEVAGESSDGIRLAPQNNKGETEVIAFYSNDNPEKLSLKEFQDKNTGPSGMHLGLYSDDNKLVKLSDGNIAYYSEKLICDPDSCYGYIIPYKDKIFILRSPVHNQVDANQALILDKIFLTFELLN